MYFSTLLRDHIDEDVTLIWEMRHPEQSEQTHTEIHGILKDVREDYFVVEISNEDGRLLADRDAKLLRYFTYTFVWFVDILTGDSDAVSIFFNY